MIRSPSSTSWSPPRARRRARCVRDFGEVENLQVSLKGPANFVTAADRRAEEIIHAELSKARPAFGFLMEERGRIARHRHEHTLDRRSARRHHQFPARHSAVRDLDRAGARGHAGRRRSCYNPITDELFMAERGRGAFLNDRRLRVAARRELADCVICCGIPSPRPRRPRRFRKELAAVQPQVAGVRRTGAAALDLAWVAAGRFDGFWERGLSPWDIAAGLVILREAGGFATDLDGGDAVFDKGISRGRQRVHSSRLLRSAASRLIRRRFRRERPGIPFRPPVP